MLELAQPQLQKWARCSTAVFSFNVYIQRDVVTSSSCYRELQCHATPSQELRFHLILNLLEVERAGVSLSAQPTRPQLYACLVFCLLSFGISCHPQLRFLVQAHMGCKSNTNKICRSRTFYRYLVSQNFYFLKVGNGRVVLPHVHLFQFLVYNFCTLIISVNPNAS
jgi:hypothetical protein